jgi:hypothetical protein
MKPPTNPPSPRRPGDDEPTGASAGQAPPSPRRPGDDEPTGASAGQVPENEGRRGPRPGGHGSYKLGGEPATGHRWHEAPAPPPAPSGHYVPPPAHARVRSLTPSQALYDDGVLHTVHEPGDLTHNEGVEHEHNDISVRALVSSAVILMVVMLVSMGLMWGLFSVFEKTATSNDPPVSPLAVPAGAVPKNTAMEPVFPPQTAAGVPLLTNEPTVLRTHRETEEKRLQGFGWVNQGAGVAHVPIETAKKLLVERGLPIRQGEAAAPTLGTRLPARGESSGGRIITAAPAGAPAENAPAAPAPSGHGEQPGEGTTRPAPTAKPQGSGHQ